MRIYLAKNYREVSIGEAILEVVTDWDFKPPRYFIEGTQAQEDALKGLGMLEEPLADGEGPERSVPVQKSAEESADELNPPAPRLPESYMCKVHQKEHKKGSSLYAVCFSKNFKPSR